jgi:predicted choloylglycine hydrolase
MPEYTATDPFAYDPEIWSYLHGQPTPYGHPEMEVIIAMVMRQQQMYYGTTKEIRLCAFLALSQNHSAS